MKNSIKKIVFYLIFSLLSINVFSKDIKPYDDNEFSSTAHDIRRFEIICLGSMPFVVFDSVLIYSSYKWAKNDFEGSFPNPFTAKSNLSNEEMKNILITSAAICVTIAVTDLVINIIKKNKTKGLETKEILILPEELNPPIQQMQEQKESDNAVF